MLVVAMASTSGFSQEKKNQSKSPDQRTDKIVERLNSEVSLTDEQKPKIKEIIEKREQARADIMKQYPDKNDAYKDAVKKLMVQSEKEIKAILTPEQIAKQKQAREQAREKRKENGNPPPAQNEPPTAPSQTK